VLDRRLAPVPPGAVGELFVGGLGVARGYLGRAGLTAERFVPDPFAGRLAGRAGDRLYRTGDLVRRRADGALEFLGRRDSQVKVRGFRIELGEVESALLLHSAIREAAVVVLGETDRDRRLAAYCVAAEGAAPAAPALRAFLRERLPDYMVPQAFVALAALPLNANGKVDRRALPAPRWDDGLADDAGTAAPRTPLEERLVALWGEVLGVEGLGIDDDFFAAGGHSLLATQLVARIRQSLGVELPLRALFQKPTVAELAPEIEKAAGSGAAGSAAGAAMQRVSRDGELPMSFSQLRQWFLVEIDPGTTAYNVPLTLELRGPLRVPVLIASLEEVVRRHESLRTTFTATGGRPRPVITSDLALPLAVHDLGALPAARRPAEVRRLVQAQGEHVFDLTRGPLLRLSLLRSGADEHLLLATVHHIVFDGWSLGVFTRDLAALYQALEQGLPSPLPSLAFQYVDYAAWQRRWLESPEGRERSAYWRARLAGAAKLLALPTDHPRPAVQSHRGACEWLELPPRLAQALRSLAAAHGATLFMTLLGGFALLLQRVTRQDDVNVGTFVANRRWQAVEPLVGFFINTLVLRCDLAGSPTVADLLARVRETTLGAYEHQDFPFEMLLDELGIERDLSRTPLFQVLLVLQNFAAPAIAMGGLTLAPIDLYQVQRANFDLSLGAVEDGQAVRIELQYNRNLFERTTILRLFGQWTALLAAAVAEPGRRAAELPLLSAAERQQVAVEWAAGGWAGGSASDLPRRLIRARAARTPDVPAVVFGDHAVSYGELERRVAGWAGHLRGLGVGPESLVGISIPRSPEMLIGVLAILEAGAGYLPLDPELPAERFALLLDDSRAVALLARGRLPAGAAGFSGPIVELDGVPAMAQGGGPAPDPEPQNLAYVIYTSGSTGRPKGVEVLHGALAQFIAAAIETYRIAAGDRVLQFASLSFDVSLEEIFPCLASGATLVLRDDGMMASPARFLAACGDAAITVLDLPTAYWHTLAAELEGGLALPASIRLVIMGGERPLPERVSGWLEAVGYRHPRLFNTYGPTEATIMSTACPLGAPGDAAIGATVVPLGRPWGGTRITLLDGRLQPVPPGASGEMHIAGSLLARGYLGRPDLTAAAFVPDPFGGSGERLYRSGDLARHRADGCMEFVGRVDDQVKIRGFRVEPGEVAAVLARHPAVGQAAVLAAEAGAGDWRLIAYVAAPQEPRPGAAELRDFLKSQLPSYMVPSDFVLLAALPMTATGKLDIGALPPLDLVREDDFVPPQTGIEEVLAEIWQELLRRERIGIYDNLFDLGGHSLLVPQIVARIEEAFQLELPLRVLFEAPTVAQLAVVVEDALLAQIEGLSDEEAAGLVGEDVLV
jgi:amino acid adenylation domain-containing protein